MRFSWDSVGIASRLLLGVSVVVFGAASCETFSSGGGAAADAGEADAGLEDARVDRTTFDAAPTCASAAWVTDPQVAAVCNGVSSFLATDPNNCGRCGLSCGDAKSCVDGHCPLVEEKVAVERLLVAGKDRIFYTPTAASKSLYVKVEGDPDPKLVESYNSAPLAAALLEQNLYVRTGNEVSFVNSQTPAGSAVAATSPSGSSPAPIAATRSAIYTTNASPREVWQYALDLKTYNIVARPDVIEVATNGTDAFLLENTTAGSLISKVPSGSVAGGLGAAHALKAGSDGYLYFAEGNRIGRVRTSGGPVETFHQAQFPIVSYIFPEASLAVDGTNAYWLEQIDTSPAWAVRMKPLCDPSGPALTLAARVGNLKGLMVTNDRIYWVHDTAQLASMAKAR
ncbi:MAG: hypothetical protein HOO96_21110 [Polyangiaceae bacterium]|nr:hypothetical protein [Polyangiaceae bacterium]